MFKDKTFLINGGTSSFGNAILKLFLNTDIKKPIYFQYIKKQDDMRKLYKNNRIKFFIGDVRNCESIKDEMHAVGYVFCDARLK